MTPETTEEHTLLRLDIISEQLRKAVCRCGAEAIVAKNVGKVWIGLHRLHPELTPGELATFYSEQLFGESLR